MTTSVSTSPAGWVDAWGPTAARTRPPGRTIDVHTHLFVPESVELVRPHQRPEHDPRTQFSSDETLALNQQFHRLAAAKYTDPEVRLADMDAMGIDTQLVAISPSQYFYWPQRELAERVADVQNERIAEVAAHASGRFVGVGTLPLQHPDAAARHARRLVATYGIRAVQLGSEAAGVDLDDARYAPLWAALEELRVVVLLHPAGFTEGQRLTDYYLVNVIGMPLSSTLTVSRLILGGVFARHPGLEMLVVHGGGYLTSYAARTDHAFRHRPELRKHIDRLPSEYVRELYVDTTVFDPAIVQRLVESHGVDRVLLGTDYPFDMGDKDPLALLEATDLTSDQRAMVAGGAAAALFGLVEQTSG